MVRWPVAESARALLWLSQWNNDRPRARAWVRVEGEKRASLVLRLGWFFVGSDLNLHRDWQESCVPMVP